MLKKPSLLLIIIYALSFSGCQQRKDDDFAIYLLAQDVPSTELRQVDINQLILESKPVISSEDIISYDKTDHILKLTQPSYTRVQQTFPIPIMGNGIPFVVCVGKKRIYTGAFWTSVSSISYDGVVIMDSFNKKENTIQIALGYPVPGVFTGNDPRSDSRIMESLEQDDKLK